MHEALLGLALVLLALFALLWWRARTRTGRENRARGKVARRAEQGAVRLLERQGYEILEFQLTARWTVLVDGEERDVHSRADLLVRRRRRRYIAEVKSGRMAPDPTRPATRRQLLEYRLAFDVDGVLLVDMEQGVVHEVAFPDLLD
jgi:Holliday junction resolvase-like predicted endonuclease